MAYYRETPSDQQDIDPKDVDGPAVVLTPENTSSYRFDAPRGDRAAWEKQICQAFGARRLPAAVAFLDQLTALCTVSYDKAQERWKPSELELNFAIGLIDSIKPRNQMEAALAAQMVAVHFMQMRVSSRVLGEQDVAARDANAREASVAGKLARTFAMQMDTLMRMRGKRATRQTINVRHEKHIHTHQHLVASGSAPICQPPSTATGDHHDGDIKARARLIGSSPEVPGEEAFGAIVPLARRAR
jgi:hypothetical protein